MFKSTGNIVNLNVLKETAIAEPEMRAIKVKCMIKNYW
jgi:hypothetical protein